MTLTEALRRYANAKRRALYWSGNPSFSVRARSNNIRSSTLDLKYELAMCDCDSWERTIETLTGERPKHYDPKAKFRANFAKMLSRRAP